MKKKPIQFVLAAALLAVSAVPAAAAHVSVDPDQFPGQSISHAYPGVALWAIGPGIGVGVKANVDSTTASPSYGPPSTGLYLFSVGTDGGSTSESNRYLRIEFGAAT